MHGGWWDGFLPHTFDVKYSQHKTLHHCMMLRDEEMFPVSTRLITAMEAPEETDNHPRTEEQPSYPNDDFDDVFGSAPSSPTSHPADRHVDNEPSDIPRLKEKHQTEGYRDGVTQGKAQSIQAGFDEGYSLGAVLGLRVGKILGLLEGIAKAVEGTEGGGLWEKAREELRLEKVFGREYWGEDGVWKFEVPGEKEGGEVVFEMVADAHPLVERWMEVVRGECEKWGVDLDIWEGEREREDDEVVKYGKHAKEKTSEVDPASEASGRILGVKKEQLNW